MKKMILSAALLFAAGLTQAQSVYTYYFNGDFHEAGGVGPDLSPVCTGGFVQDTLTDFGTFTRQVYHFDQNCGFEFDDSLNNFISSGTYSIELYFKLESLTSWKRVIDFKLRTTDYGCYVLNGQLNFYSVASSSGAPFAPNEYSHYVITRNDTTKDILMYGDGNNYINFNDASGHGVYSANKKLRFFQDDLVVPNEASAGSIGLLRIYNYALDSNTIHVLNDSLSTTLAIGSQPIVRELGASAYPNPVGDELNISLPAGKYNYELISYTGSVLGKGELTENGRRINVSLLPAGMYVVKIVAEDGTRGSLKFCKQ